MLRRVVITGTGAFLPNDPVPNDRIDSVLGPLDGAPERVQKFVQTVGRRMLEASGVQYRHFAIDPTTGDLTHTLAGLGEEAARKALAAARKKPEDVELLVFAGPSYDQSTPPTSTLLQERLGIERCAEMEIHSNCSGVGKSMQVAYDALRLGRYRNALVVYSQLSSVYLRSCYFNPAKLTKTQATLRYILADGSGAVFLEAADPASNGSLRREVIGTYIESVGGRSQPAMTAGGSVNDLIKRDQQTASVWERGTHHLDQDFSAVGRLAAPVLFEGIKRLAASLDLAPGQVRAIVASIPSRQLYDEGVGPAMDYFGLSREQIPFRGQKTGYCGGASLFVHLDEMVRTDAAKPGDVVIVHSVESSKWMTAGFAVRW